MTSIPEKILYIHYPSDLYGASRSLLRLTASLDRAEFIPLVVLKQDGPLRERLEANGVTVILDNWLCVIERRTLSSWRVLSLPFVYLISVIRLARIISKERCALVHTNTGIILSSALAARLSGAAHVWHIRDWFGEFHSMWPFFSRYITGFSDRVICVSRAIANQFPVQKSVEVLHNGFDPAEFFVDRPSLRNEFRSRYGLAEEFVVGTVGRIKFVRKGQEVLVQAVSILKRKGVRCKCLVVGSVFEGNEEHLTRLEALIRELGLQEDVILTGDLKDPRPAYAAMDVFVLPSAQPEPFGGVVMEAMSMSLPVIGTAIGGTVDQIVDGTTGYLIRPGDPAVLAESIEKLYADRNLSASMGLAGAGRVRVEFSLARTSTQIQRTYRDIIRKKHK